MAASWRGHWGGLQAHARASAARVNFDSLRFFDGKIGSEDVHKETRADWNGTLYSAAGSVSYEHMIGGISVRPVVALDYYRLNEDAYRESGGGSAIDLIIDKRSGDELAVTASLAAGMNFGGLMRYDQWSRIEIEAGRRERIAGALGSTTANFAGGTPFTIDPEGRDGGWIGKVRAITGTTEFRLSAEGGAEQRLGNVALSARAALQFAF
ncbi:MAG: autotransporter outer membrane beta-barrel domain-containing protein [Comamonadaceae bacterium]|nr:MAG: autotransporter outer membrane beta-barrel domain-containing protein [Comamonadaceae bacterium]